MAASTCELVSALTPVSKGIWTAQIVEAARSIDPHLPIVLVSWMASFTRCSPCAAGPIDWGARTLDRLVQQGERAPRTREHPSPERIQGTHLVAPISNPEMGGGRGLG